MTLADLIAQAPPRPWEWALLPPGVSSRLSVNANGCWLWAGPTSGGYARYGYRERWLHRRVWLTLGNQIPEGLCLDHLCRVRHCVNPAHLEVVTYLENALRSEKTTAGRQVCVRGHPLRGDNLKVVRHSDGGLKRQCQECRRIRRRAYEARRRAREAACR